MKGIFTPIILALATIMIAICDTFGPRFTISGPDRNRPRQITSQGPKHEKVTLRVYPRPLREIGAHVPFGEQICEEGYNLLLRWLEIGDQSAELILKSKAKDWPVIVSDISVFKGK